jgi:ribosomal protein S18 acetylase RimI-like enzyme
VPEYDIRDATVDDAQGIAHVHTRTWQIAYDHVFPTNRLAGIVEEHRAEWWSGRLAEEPSGGHTVVANESAAIVGFADFGPTLDPEASQEHVAELYAIYVLPEAWGRGIGRALMAEVLERLRQDGYREAILWVIEDNPRTRRYYELAGWQFDGGEKQEAVLDVPVRQVRYRIALER